jgi:aspartate 1-decarboxylase
MLRTLLKSKIRCVGVTYCESNHEGLCAIDKDLLEAANIPKNEQIYILPANARINASLNTQLDMLADCTPGVLAAGRGG